MSRSSAFTPGITRVSPSSLSRASSFLRTFNAGVNADERDMLIETQPNVFYFTDHYRDWPIVLIRLPKARKQTVEALLLRHWKTLASKSMREASGL